MKKLLSLILILCLSVTVLSACGGSEDEVAELPTNTTDVASVQSEDNMVEEVPATPTTTPTPPANKMDIKWTNYTHTMTDNDGYTYEITYKMSPWILLSNSEYINTAWSEVGKSKTLPQFGDWGLQKGGTGSGYSKQVRRGNYSGQPFIHDMTDMYYCVGNVSVKNVTNGWEINSSSPRSIYHNLAWMSAFKRDNTYVYTIGRTLYSNSVKEEADSIVCSASMTQNQWGPVPFVMMAPENFSPNHPNGERAEDMLKGYFSVVDPSTAERKKIHLGVINKEGIYMPPSESIE